MTLWGFYFGFSGIFIDGDLGKAMQAVKRWDEG